MGETFRQTVHLLMGLLGAAVILRLDDRGGAFVFVSAALVIQFLLCDAFTRGYDVPVLSRVMDESERTGKVPLKGGIAYAAGALFCLAVFGRGYTAVGLVTVGVLDSVSTLIGLRFGRHTLVGKKSLEGTIAGGSRGRACPLLPDPPLVGGRGCGGGGRRHHRGLLPARRQRGDSGGGGVRDAGGGGSRGGGGVCLRRVFSVHGGVVREPNLGKARLFDCGWQNWPGGR
ncbi:hypothetical protein [Methanoculleus chikugoensis]|uniref:diacylglycerol/polyprenol kinase family protein n=1 Tax=Methanoculleus chikugoensis TaxID=118126 RepID=UPI0006D06001|nr:hypothetical protein [Methanoculleus chikugoensis]